MLLLAASCGSSSNKTDHPSFTTDTLRYATNLACQRGKGFSVWTLRNPWDTTQVLHKYVLLSDDAQLQQLPNYQLSNCQIIRVPVRRAGVATAVHCGLIDELECGEAIAGVCDRQYIHLPIVTEGLSADGGSAAATSTRHIADFGNGMNPNIERIIDTAPDVLLLTPFEHSGGYGRVERLGIPIVECAEYMETSPLARAEWIRFYGELFGAESMADSIFRAVESDYNSLCEHASTATVCPRLLAEMLYGGQWFVPCANSTMGIMYRDARADYVFADREGSGSVPLAFETVLDKAQDADVWLVKYNSPQPLTYNQMAADYQPYTRFRAWQQRRIYGCNLAHSHFYEQTPFHPERLLRDIIAILHPDLMPDYQPIYYAPLE